PTTRRPRSVAARARPASSPTAPPSPATSVGASVGGAAPTPSAGGADGPRAEGTARACSPKRSAARTKPLGSSQGSSAPGTGGSDVSPGSGQGSGRTLSPRRTVGPAGERDRTPGIVSGAVWTGGSRWGRSVAAATSGAAPP